jgi:hypothetical protein
MMAGDFMLCPVCMRGDAGKIGENRFFCCHCCVEFNNAAEVRIITENGDLVKATVPGR